MPETIAGAPGPSVSIDGPLADTRHAAPVRGRPEPFLPDRPTPWTGCGQVIILGDRSREQDPDEKLPIKDGG